MSYIIRVSRNNINLGHCSKNQRIAFKKHMKIHGRFKLLTFQIFFELQTAHNAELELQNCCCIQRRAIYLRSTPVEITQNMHGGDQQTWCGHLV